MVAWTEKWRLKVLIPLEVQCYMDIENSFASFVASTWAAKLATHSPFNLSSAKRNNGSFSTARGAEEWFNNSTF